MEFGVLGPLLLRGPGGDIRIGSRQQRRLLTALLTTPGTVVSTDRLIDILWPGTPPASAVPTLHAYVSRLRSLLPDGVLLTRPPGYLLHVPPGDLDARRFEQLLADAKLDQALALWRGPAYAEFADDDFARPEAARLEELRLTAIEQRFETRLTHGDNTVGELEAYASEHPLRERPRQLLMTALYRAGRQAEALAVYRDFRAHLDTELGVQPGAALRSLETAILRQDPALDATRTTLPAATAPLIGRTRDITAVTTALSEHRLVTLTGMGGVGKTRLALAAATRLGPAAFAGLADITEPTDVAPALATATGATQQPGHTIEESLLAYLHPRTLLLVVDNCEHVLDETARLTDTILRRCPHITVLATSRTPLGITGERLLPTTPLPPDDAVQLFLDRARAVRPGFAPHDGDLHHVTDLCRTLDGLPLAIELAAARIRSLNPADLAERMADRFAVLTAPRSAPVARHRTLRNLVDWSYALLTEDQQHLLARLSVFAGGWTLTAAEHICDADLDGLAALADASLISVGPARGETRYTMLETLRAYGTALLTDPATLRDAHATYYTALAERAGPHLVGPHQQRWTALLDADYGNLRAAHRWATSTGNTDLALRLSAGLYYYVLHQFRDEVVSWGTAALALPGAPDHPHYAAACGAVGEGLTLRGELDQAASLARHALDRFPDPGDQRRLPVLKVRTAVALYQGRLDECFALTGDSLHLAHRHGDAVRATEAHLFRGLARTYAGDPAAGLRHAGENRTAAHATGNPSLIAWALYNEAEALAALHQPTAARTRYTEAIALAATVHDAFAATIAEVGLAALLARTGETGTALQSFARVVAAWHRMQVWHHQWTTLRNLGHVLADAGAHEDAATLLAAVTTAGPPPFGADATRQAETLERLSDALGPAYTTATARGATLTPDAAVEFALRAARLTGREAPG
jgi:predicted ATPase/DNA-binding SARP family transcriptional activator